MLMKEIQDLLKHEAEAILNIPADEAFYKAKDLIYKRVHEMKGKLVCSGMGKAGQIALNMATTFSSTGTPAVFLHPSDAQHGDLGIVRENDLLLLISNSGKTREIIELVSLSEKLNGKLPLIVIGSNSRSDLARMAGMKQVRARLYYDAGADTVEALAKWEPEALLTMLQKFVERSNFNGIAPLPKEVRHTVASARKMQKIVKY